MSISSRLDQRLSAYQTLFASGVWYTTVTVKTPLFSQMIVLYNQHEAVVYVSMEGESMPCVMHGRLPGVLVGVFVLLLGMTVNVFANPKDYPQYAQQKVDADIPIVFVTSEQVKQRLDADAPQMLVDVRDAASYQKGHLPGAVSIPLSEFPHRAVQIPRDIDVVLY
jgi:hypothetical protein